jgi:hypothetical protein
MESKINKEGQHLMNAFPNTTTGKEPGRTPNRTGHTAKKGKNVNFVPVDMSYMESSQRVHETLLNVKIPMMVSGYL